MEGNVMFWLFNEERYLENKEDSQIVSSLRGTLRDHCARNVASFILGILHRGRFGVCEFMISVLYLAKFKEKTLVSLHDSNWRPLFLTALLLADKMWEDRPVKNSSLVQLFPALSAAELFEMEIVFLKELDFDLRMWREDFQLFCEKMLAETVSCEISCVVTGSEYAATLEEAPAHSGYAASEKLRAQSTPATGCISGLSATRTSHPWSTRKTIGGSAGVDGIPPGTKASSQPPRTSQQSARKLSQLSPKSQLQQPQAMVQAAEPRVRAQSLGSGASGNEGTTRNTSPAPSLQVGAATGGGHTVSRGASQTRALRQPLNPSARGVHTSGAATSQSPPRRGTSTDSIGPSPRAGNQLSTATSSWNSAQQQVGANKQVSRGLSSTPGRTMSLAKSFGGPSSAAPPPRCGVGSVAGVGATSAPLVFSPGARLTNGTAAPPPPGNSVDAHRRPHNVAQRCQTDQSDFRRNVAPKGMIGGSMAGGAINSALGLVFGRDRSSSPGATSATDGSFGIAAPERLGNPAGALNAIRSSARMAETRRHRAAPI